MSDEPTTAQAGTDAAPSPSRIRAQLVVLLGGFVGTLGGLASILLVLSFAFSGSSSWGLASFLALVGGIVVGGLIASLGFRGLGVRRGWRAALLGATVGAVGFFGPWLTAAVLART
jgi:predicted lipid-binding transport protein (Tim44 family)